VCTIKQNKTKQIMGQIVEVTMVKEQTHRMRDKEVKVRGEYGDPPFGHKMVFVSKDELERGAKELGLKEMRNISYMYCEEAKYGGMSGGWTFHFDIDWNISGASLCSYQKMREEEEREYYEG